MRGQRLRRLPETLLALSLVVLAGCAAASSPKPAASHAASPAGRSPAEGGPGTSLRDGFEVAADSRLLGPVFPQQHGWVAVLQVGDHPLQVVQDYLRQAAAHGLQADLQCEADVPSGRSFSRQPLDDAHPVRGRAQAVICAASAARQAGPAWNLYVHWGTYYDRTTAFASAVMDYQPPATQASPVAAVTAPRTMPPMVDWKLPGTAGAGERFDGGYTGVKLTVADGTQLLAPVADSGCGTGGLAAVLRVTGGGDATSSAYVQQLAADRYEAGPAVPVADGGTYVDATLAGGGDVSLTRLAVAGTTWLLIQVCGD